MLDIYIKSISFRDIEHNYQLPLNATYNDIIKYVEATQNNVIIKKLYVCTFHGYDIIPTEDYDKCIRKENNRRTMYYMVYET